jgi:hypothetical protein
MGIRSRRDLALLEMVMHKHQRVALAWHVKYERLRHATHEYKSILPDHIACHACGNIVDFHLAFVHARVPMSHPMQDAYGIQIAKLEGDPRRGSNIGSKIRFFERACREGI